MKNSGIIRPDLSSTSSDPGKERAEVLIELLKLASENASKQYSDSYKGFVGLDSKAQGTATISGVVLAAVVGFVSPESIRILILYSGYWSFALLLIPVILALTAVACSILSMRVRSVVAPFGADVQLAEYEDLKQLRADELNRFHYVRFLKRRLDDWISVIDDLDKAVTSKSRTLLYAQNCLFFALLFLAALLVFLMLSNAVTGLHSAPIVTPIIPE